MYMGAAQYNMPPYYLVNKIFNAIDQASFENKILENIYSGLVVGYGNQTCLDTNPTYSSKFFMGWGWQVVYILLYIVFKYTLLH
jgi:lysosomal Pro-X carboxypeptidase